jgi:hypothetical protein
MGLDALIAGGRAAVAEQTGTGSQPTVDEGPEPGAMTGVAEPALLGHLQLGELPVVGRRRRPSSWPGGPSNSTKLPHQKRGFAGVRTTRWAACSTMIEPAILRSIRSVRNPSDTTRSVDMSVICRLRPAAPDQQSVERPTGPTSRRPAPTARSAVRRCRPRRS